ncbi:DUF2993 domain-containing protein [Phormidium pseudopriestleyi FRX01]|uniref:DUF2993 domain-containing protein n=1 Tax=Phormidium pseudopriestleyi FRX01 TaxID=1759528 RepID=A0ABS3FRU2_9CYAN|nr:DUF2993 domain-containing protein [Phormidium pseudopriestleyi]MBO0349830.1 DUF2993 domain-containing protein [Phormidium pseudopriestleyi FRX01]
MELLTLVLTGILTLVSPVGVTFDNIAEGDIREALHDAEQLEVRLDNAPNYSLLRGNIQRLRFAGRGLYVTPELRIDTVEIESDPIAVDINRLNQENATSIPRFLREPLQGAMRVVITEADLNRALRSQAAAEPLRELGIGITRTNDPEAQTDPQRFQIVNPEVEFLANNRVRFQLEIEDRRDNESVQIVLETGLASMSGARIQAVNPTILINNEEAPTQLITIFSRILDRALDLRKYEDRGLLARVLKFELDADRLEVAAFIRIDQPDAFSVGTPE